ncbi:MAG TPA: hypothetical protein VFZ25_14265, partial [Chloroflexota bacterium]|nr:hypothetical protein [Chloroflexota bacterium]
MNPLVVALLVSLVIGLALTLGATRSQAAAGSAATLSVNPSAATSGASVQVAAKGFPHRSTITIYLDDRQVLAGTTGGAGAFKGSFKVASNVAPGNHTVSASDNGTRANVVLAVTAPATVTGSGHSWFVSRNGNNSTGNSWANAWNELSAIQWGSVQPGDTIWLDGGSTACSPAYDFNGTRPGVSCGMQYNTTMTVGASGTSAAPIKIRLSTEAGHNGTAVFFGGRATPLPYCHQSSYSAGSVRAYGILVGAYHDVVIDGGHISGIMIYGANFGIRVSSSAAANLTFARMEIFDNGVITKASGSGGYNSDNPGISLSGGLNTLIKGNLIHDNGQDEIQDGTRSNNSLNGLVLDTDWLYNRRGNPLYPGYPFNEPQSTGCTHVDGLQLWSGGPTQSGLTVKHSIFGPLLNQGVYPSDSGTGAVWTNVSITDSLFLTITHSIMADSPVHGWTVDHNTLFTPNQNAGMELPSNGANTLTNVVKYGGYVYTPSWTGTTG